VKRVHFFLTIETERDPAYVYTYLKSYIENLPEVDVELETGKTAGSRLIRRITPGIFDDRDRVFMTKQIKYFFATDDFET
jgi:hypothetical protein